MRVESPEQFYPPSIVTFGALEGTIWAYVSTDLYI